MVMARVACLRSILLGKLAGRKLSRPMNGGSRDARLPLLFPFIDLGLVAEEVREVREDLSDDEDEIMYRLRKRTSSARADP